MSQTILTSASGNVISDLLHGWVFNSTAGDWLKIDQSLDKEIVEELYVTTLVDSTSNKDLAVHLETLLPEETVTTLKETKQELDSKQVDSTDIGSVFTSLSAEQTNAVLLPAIALLSIKSRLVVSGNAGKQADCNKKLKAVAGMLSAGKLPLELKVDEEGSHFIVVDYAQTTDSAIVAICVDVFPIPVYQN